MNVTKRKRNVLIATALIFSIIGVGSVYEVAQGSSTKALTSQVKVASTSVAPTASIKVVPVVPVTPVTPVNPQATLKVVAPAKVAVVPIKTAVVPVAKTAPPLVKTVTKVATKVFTKGTVKTFVSVKPNKVTVLKGSTVTTKTVSGSQTLTVNTNKVTVSVTPTVSGNPTVPQAPATVNNPVLTPQIPDWKGFVAPKITFDKIVACQSLGLVTNNAFGASQTLYNWNLTPQFKITDGNYLGDINGNYILQKPNSIAYENTHYIIGINSMSTTPSSGSTMIELKLSFEPFNWTPNSYGEPTVIWAPGYETDKMVSYAISIPYTAKDC